jgi:uncharacterized repeat protein (TIGR01451 family)
MENALDIEWAHAMAPKATIFLVEVAYNSSDPLYLAQAFEAANYLVATHGGGEVSSCWMVGTFTDDPNYYYPPTQDQINQFDQVLNTNYANVIDLACAGDIGTAQYPAGSPYAIAVGGTKINRDANYNFVNETTWNDGVVVNRSSGFGPFLYQNANEPRPSYQDHAQSTAYRVVPDITLYSSPGVPVFCNNSWTTDPNGRWYNTFAYGAVGGTSLATPMSAGILNSMNITKTNSAKTIHQTLYNWGPDPKHFRDITSGTDENFDNAPQNPNYQMISNAAPGFDICTGWGSLLYSPSSNPALTITKTPNPLTYSASGQTITYTYTVKNTGNVELNAVKVVDSILGPITLLSTDLAPNAQTTGTATYQTTVADMTAGSVTNTATVYNGTQQLNQTTAKVTATQPSPNPALTITKTPNPLTYSASGQTITYTYTVKNTGNVEIKGPITVTDDKSGTITIPNSDTLSPGSSVIGTATYTITDTDINAGPVTNSAYATGSFNSQPVISPSVIAIVSYEQPTKKEEHNEEEHNGDRDNYGGPGYGGYGGAVIPMIPGPMYGSPMYGSEPYGYGGEPYGPTGTPNSDSNAHKAKAHLSKHKHKSHSKNNHKTKHHTTKHHKTEKKNI